MKAEKVDLERGFIGISRGDTTINAIIWGEDDEFYFLVIGHHAASALEAWDEENRTSWSALCAACKDEGLTDTDLDLLYDGTVPHE